MKALRLAIAIPGIAVLVWLGWIIIQVTRADELAQEHPEAALRIDPDHPQALLSLAKKQLESKDYDAATATAQRALRVEPGQGSAFAAIALAAMGRGDKNSAELTKIATQRAPRNINVRTQALVAALQKGDMEGAAEQVDAILRVSPRRGEVLFPAISSQTMVPAFRDALLDRIALSPRWARQFLIYVAGKGAPEAVERVYSGLQDRNLLSAQDMKRWLDRQMREGEWRKARDHWAALLGADPDSLPLVYNGGFEERASGIGFDWRRMTVPGVFSRFENQGDAGVVAHFQFIGRPAAAGDLRQPVLLTPGPYRLSIRARAEFLHSDQGLQWVVRCDRGPTIAAIGPLKGSFGWRKWEQVFDVPVAPCKGQWLELRNPAVRGSAQQVSGDLWVDDVSIEAL